MNIKSVGVREKKKWSRKKNRVPDLEILSFRNYNTDLTKQRQTITSRLGNKTIS